MLADEFGRSFYGANTVVVAPIYPAGEQPISGVDASMLADKCRSYGHKDVHVAGELDSLAEELADQVSSGDLVITLGAGSVWRVGEALLHRLRGHASDTRRAPPEPIEAPAVGRSGATSAADLVADLEGEAKVDHPMTRCTSFRLGGPAEVVFIPSSEAAAAEAIARAISEGVTVTAIGGGTNLLVADRGVGGIVLSPGPAFGEIRFENDGRVLCGAAAPLAKVMRQAIARGWVGMETLAGIPGSIGGAAVMNAGTRDGEIGELIVAVRGVDRTGRLIEVAGKDLNFAYRSSQISKLGLTLLEIELTLEQGDAVAASRRAYEIRHYRNRTQPHKVRSAGSVFKNPPGESAGRLLDRSGLKGVNVGGARVSEVHANFLTAEKGCSASEIAGLIERCRQAVWDQHQIGLELEIQPLGFDPGELPPAWSGG
ncbi:MAG: UDP-N-acetylenolpyruvoylglucosamine reductase [Gemmatimonadetes bacterium]|nr:UDP-N-acetylenolpyruvoylglucosamine reductase [Gemmatimonadota bacterium]